MGLKKRLVMAGMVAALIVGGAIAVCLQAIRTLVEDAEYKRRIFKKDWRFKK